MDFKDLKATGDVGSLFQRLTPVEAQLGPPDFRIFLKQVGHGCLADESLYIYPGTAPPQDIFGDEWKGPALELFADDMAGTVFGFQSMGQVVEVSADGNVSGVVAPNFETFIRSWLEL